MTIAVQPGVSEVAERDLAVLPKAHLHLHLEGAMRPETLEELAARAGVVVPPRDHDRFDVFIVAYQAACEVIATHEDLARLVDEVVEDDAGNGVSWLEITIDPWLHVPRLGSATQVMDTLVRAGREAGERHGVGVGFVVAADRGRGPDAAVVSAGLAAAYMNRGVVAFGLANDERLGIIDDFVPAFTMARAAGLLAAPHAGELCGPDAVRAAIDELGARRVGHGTSATNDRAVLELLAERHVGVEACLTSNEAIGVCPVAEHPVAGLVSAGVPVSLHADDPLLFDTDITREYQRARNELGLDDTTLARMARAGFETSAAPDGVRQAGLIGIDAWLTDRRQ